MQELGPGEWLEVVRREYLEDFVLQSGAAVKFVVCRDGADRLALRDGLRQAAEDSGYQLALADATTTRIHLIDRLFHEVARQVDWDALAQAFLRRVLADSGLRLPPSDEPAVLPALAALNDRSETLLRGELHALLDRELFRDYAMSREFRLAMLQVCYSQLDPHDDPALVAAVHEWLRGELRLVSALKRALIFQKVNRHNARHLLFSLAHWLTRAGRRGLVLGLDVSRYAEARRRGEDDEGLYYSFGAAWDAYEVLRQLIDATDELEHCFGAVLAGPELLHEDNVRGVGRYRALYYRIADEVRDRYRSNPLGALVRVAGVSRRGPE
jgi:hypothetical protein